MKKFRWTTLAAAAMLLASCSDDVVLTPDQAREASPESNAITFGTYTGNSRQTRAEDEQGEGSGEGNTTTGGVGGYTGSMTTETLKAENSGFGVFAFYTGTNKYGDAAYRGAGKYPDFMYNEHIYWNTESNVWQYDNIKYWPNEFNDGATEAKWNVDDQNNDTNNDPATTEGQNGGNLTFFAYAPWVDASQSTANAVNGATTKATSDNTKTSTEGIVNISGNAWVGAAKGEGSKVEARKGDPYITYVLAKDNPVDLLWGTAGTNDIKANGAAQSAQTTGLNPFTREGLGTGDGEKTTEETPAFTNKPYTETFANDILKGYTVNDNLNKMTTTGKVNFVFKHALSKMGGSYVGPGKGDDEDGATPTNGLMVILDIDNNGAETGGSLQGFTGDKDDSGKTPYNTKVTINEIEIESGAQLKDNVDINSQNFTYTTDGENPNVEPLTNKGELNLATGRWGNLSSTNSTIKTSTTKIVPSDGKTEGSTDGNQDAILSKELAEPDGFTTEGESRRTNRTADGFKSLPIGVTTVAKNVYEKEAQPLVFIPGTKPILTFTITYTVRTYDKNLKDFYTEVKQKIKKRLYITQETELNKQYNILMHLGLTSVKFTATVSDWEATSVAGTTTTPGEGVSPVTVFDEDIEHVYLPINVSGLALTATQKNAGSTLGDDANVITVTAAKYWTIKDGKSVENTLSANDENSIKWEKLGNDGFAEIPTSGDGEWLEVSNGDLKAKSANTDFAPRSAVVRAKYTKDDATYYSENYTVTQYGRIPTAVDLKLETSNSSQTRAEEAEGSNEGSNEESNNIEVEAKGGDVTYSDVKVTNYYEVDKDGKKVTPETTTDVTITPVGFVVADWITPGENKFTVDKNETNKRVSTIAVKVNDLYTVMSNKTITQSAGTASSNEEESQENQEGGNSGSQQEGQQEEGQ